MAIAAKHLIARATLLSVLLAGASLGAALSQTRHRTYGPADVEAIAAQLVGTEHMEDAQKILIPACKKPTATGAMHALLAKTYMDDPYDSTRLTAVIKSELDTALKMDPEGGIVCRVMAEHENLKGNQKGAIAWAQKSLKAKKQDRDLALRQLVIAYSNLGDFTSAYKYEEERATFTGPNEAHFRNKAMLLEKLNKRAEAVTAWREALKLRDVDTTLMQLVACLERGGQYKEAIVELSRQLKRNPVDGEVLRKRATLWLKLKNTREALNDYTAAIASEPTTRLYKERAEIYKANGQLKEAANDLKSAADEDKHSF